MPQIHILPPSCFYYIETSVLLENTPLIKFIRNYIWDSSGVFCISSLVKISMISLTSSLSLKLYLNSLVYDWNIIGSSLKVFSNLYLSLEIFGRWSVTLVWPSDKFWGIFWKSSGSGRKSSENHQKRRHQYVYIIKRTLHVSSKIWILCSSHSNIKFISSRHRVISSIYFTIELSPQNRESVVNTNLESHDGNSLPFVLTSC